ncbi:MAG: zinc ribbon domain-containing protein [Chloroflexi bacterium]|nr:zinc ribbon domain-containing protein [Chloroflexota bacterium]MCL5276037.1 zinc ribbon domain-containing protein [Chloroflexota bacterium]
MPIFEYDCPDCGEPFEKLVRLHNGSADKVACPSCGSTKVKRKLSTFSAKSSGGSTSFTQSSSSDCSTGGS